MIGYGYSFLAERRTTEVGDWLWVWMQGVLVMPEDWIEVVW